MSNLVKHAKNELKLAGLFDKDSDYNGGLGIATLELIKTFSKQGHSGTSAALVTSLAEKLMRYGPLTPLTGKDNEWTEVTDGMYQNNRDSRVFKNSKDGQAYFIDGRVFRDKDGSTWTNGKSRVNVVFPYTPKTKYVNRRWWKFWL